MQHMLLPENPTGSLARVPYVCSGHERYSGEFLTYPRRMGKARMAETETDPLAVDYFLYEKLHPTPREEQEPFFQTWLFFGLVSEILGGNDAETAALLGATPDEISRTIYEEFVDKDDTGEYINTANLFKILEKSWKPPRGDVEFRKERYMHLSECLSLAWRMLYTTCPDFDLDIKDSIASVGEILAHSVFVAGRVLNATTKLMGTWGSRAYSPSICAEMKSFGWCPSDIARVIDTFTHIQTLHMLSKMRRLRPNDIHENCTDERCNAYQVSPEDYVVEHYENGCGCTFLSVDSEEVVQVLDKGDVIPLLKISIDGDDLETLRVSIVESGPGVPYVAISHPWADGLGNYSSNSLHRCQIAALHQLVGSISETHDAPGARKEYYIWIDTLCCPVKPPAKRRLAILQMHEVYKRAEHVLVLDRELQSIKSADIHSLEQGLRMLTSGWMLRLWTLQEGALAVSFLHTTRTLLKHQSHSQQRNLSSFNFQTLQSA
jgi:hypothetical protein